ncbi:hypothetical protein GCM10023095_04160 [Pseudaeromonas paramecii]|uniref:Uncharacterized protein n=1 Tax=Pseudaeromonas paramecii TaxID=2138166 RepID=A0ABP8PZ57_9GAMM
MDTRDPSRRWGHNTGSQRWINAPGAGGHLGKTRAQLKEGALQNGLPELVVIPNDREGLAQKGAILFFQL